MVIHWRGRAGELCNDTNLFRVTTSESDILHVKRKSNNVFLRYIEEEEEMRSDCHLHFNTQHTVSTDEQPINLTFMTGAHRDKQNRSDSV